MEQFNEFCKILDFNNTTRIEQSKAFIWFHIRSIGAEEIDLKTINNYFKTAHLPEQNVTLLKTAYTKDRDVIRGTEKGRYKLTRFALDNYEKNYGNIFEKDNPPKITDKAGIQCTPLLNESDIDEAMKMAELYVILHCYENSVRKLIETILSSNLGANWWEIAANNGLKTKVNHRKETESKNKWLSPRGGNSPLYYVDWGDLVSLIRKFETLFIPIINDTKFVELRLEELERLRNIVAHHGTLPSDDDFQRVVLSFRDWCRQICTS